ncbi:MAG: sodium/solute symporter [Kiritimatiellia bacterium]|jgi:SSS family transporter|nr:sodium/solute symporter [Kiritimatiellia bacterium]
MKNWLIVCLCLVVSASAFAEESKGMLDWEELPPLPDELGVAGPFAGTSGDALVVAGGANFPEPVWDTDKVWRDAVYVLEKSADGENFEWTTAGSLPQPIAYGMSVSHKDRVICVGGNDSTQTFASVFAMTWDAETKAVRYDSLPDLPSPCAFGQAALIGDVLYVAGGQSGSGIESAMKNFWSLDLSREGSDGFEWQVLMPWPGPERVLGIVTAQNNGRDKCVYVMSGRRKVNGEFDFLKDAYEFTPRKYDATRYDAAAGTYNVDKRVGAPWRTIPDVPTCVMAGTGVAVGQAHIFILGGADGTLVPRVSELKLNHPGFPRRTLAYHTITESWVDAGPSPMNQVTTVTVAWGGKIVIPSGEIKPRVRTVQINTVSLKTRAVRFGMVNYLTVVLYLAVMVGIGVYFARKNKSTEDFFRGGQSIPWWAAGCSIFATMLSSITFVALPAVAFKTDWTVWIMQWTIPIMAFFVIWKVLPFFRQLDVTSAYEYLERRFGYSARVLGSLLFSLFQVGRMAVVMYLPALALQAVTGLEPIPCILIMGVLSIVYCTMGGIEAVIWTDTIQTFVLLGGALLSVIIILVSIDGGFGTFFVTAMEHNKFHMVDWDFSSTSYMTTAIWVIIFGAVFQNLSSYSSDQAVIQRYMTTDTQKNAANAILTNGLMAVPASMLFFGVGTALFVFYKLNPAGLDPSFKADAIFPLFIATKMPPVVAGLVVAGVFAAAQSTLSTSMNSLSTTMVTDFARPMNACRDEKGYLSLARWLTALLGILGTGMAVLFVVADVFDIFSTYVSILGMFMGVLCGMFMLGMFTRRANLAGCLGGTVATSLFMLWLKFQSGLGIHGYIYPAISVTLCVLLGYLISMVIPGKQKDQAGLTVYAMKG